MRSVTPHASAFLAFDVLDSYPVPLFQSLPDPSRSSRVQTIPYISRRRSTCLLWFPGPIESVPGWERTTRTRLIWWIQLSHSRSFPVRHRDGPTPTPMITGRSFPARRSGFETAHSFTRFGLALIEPDHARDRVDPSRSQWRRCLQRRSAPRDWCLQPGCTETSRARMVANDHLKVPGYPTTLYLRRHE